MMSVEAAREIIRRCRVLAACSDEPGFTTRTFLSNSMRVVLVKMTTWMSAAGMHVSVDAAGNLRGVYAGATADARRLLIGSHLDTVPHAGAFDGVLGVVMGLSLVESLQGTRLPFSIEVIGFSEEEGVRFGVPFIGSRAVVGELDRSLLAARDAEGVTVEQAIRNFGLDPSRIADARTDANPLGYLEFHIEQGPILEAANRPLAVVDRITGRSSGEVTFVGAAGHSGTTPMNIRQDAVAGAAEWIGCVESHAHGTKGLVATIGRIDADPGAANVIAGRCHVTLDVRHADDRVRAAAVERFRVAAHEIGARRRLQVEWAPRLDQPSAEMDPQLVAMLARALEAAGAPTTVMLSGAGHDAMVLAPHMPAAMLFIRTPGGISHHPAESVDERDVAIAFAAGTNFLNQLAASIGV
jgi:allantoate deiminase